MLLRLSKEKPKNNFDCYGKHHGLTKFVEPPTPIPTVNQSGVTGFFVSVEFT